MAESVTIGTLVIKLSADGVELVRGFKEAQEKVEEGSAGMMKAVSVMGAAVAGVLAGMAAEALHEFSEFEDSMLKLQYTLGSEPALVNQMTNAIMQLSSEIPVSSSELAKLAGTAAQLGVPKDRIIEFTKTMADFGEVSGMNARQATEEFVKLSNVLGVPQSEVENLASAVVALGHSMSTTEAQVLSLSMQMAGTGNLLGLTKTQVLGLAAALSSMGAEGGMAVDRMMVELQKAMHQGGDTLSAFAKIAGTTSGQFTKLFAQDPLKAIQVFLGGVKQMQASGGDLIGTLDKVGLGNARMMEALLKAADASDLIAKGVKTASDEYEKNTRLAKDAALAHQTFGAQIKVTLNELQNFADGIGKALAPSVEALNFMLKDALSNSKAWSDYIKSTVNEVVLPVTIAGLSALTFAFKALQVSIAQSVDQFQTAMGVLKTIGMTAIEKDALKAMSIAFNPGNIVGLVKDLATQFQQVSNQIGEAGDRSAARWKKAWDDVTQSIAKMQEQFDTALRKASDLANFDENAARSARTPTKVLAVDSFPDPSSFTTDTTAAISAIVEAQKAGLGSITEDTAAALSQIVADAKAGTQYITGGAADGVSAIGEEAKAISLLSDGWMRFGKSALEITDEQKAAIEDLNVELKAQALIQEQNTKAAQDAIDAAVKQLGMKFRPKKNAAGQEDESLGVDMVSTGKSNATSLAGLEDTHTKFLAELDFQKKFVQEQLDILNKASADGLKLTKKDLDERAAAIKAYTDKLKELNLAPAQQNLNDMAKQLGIKFRYKKNEQGEEDPNAGAEMSPESKFDPFGGTGDANSHAAHQLAMEKKMYEDLLKTQKDFQDKSIGAGKAFLDEREILNEAAQKKLKAINIAIAEEALTSAQSIFGSLADMAQTFAGKQSAIYQAMFAASKAFAIADATIKIMQGIAEAAGAPWPENIAAMASVAAATSSIVSSIQAVTLNITGGTPKQMGGPVSEGTTYIVGERGPELFVPTEDGHIVPNHQLGDVTNYVAENVHSALADYQSTVTHTANSSVLGDSVTNQVGGDALTNINSNLQHALSSYASVVSGMVGGNGADNSTRTGDVWNLLQNTFDGARAVGGPVDTQHSFMVGERGPELFVPDGASNSVQAIDALTRQVISSPVSQFFSDHQSATDQFRSAISNASRDVSSTVNQFAAQMAIPAGEPIPPTISPVGARAAGGPVTSGLPYMVGEKGPELFVPGEHGDVIPSDQLGDGPAAAAGQSTKVVVNNYTDIKPEVREEQNGNEKTLTLIIKRVKDEIGSEIREGRGVVTKALNESYSVRRGVR